MSERTPDCTLHDFAKQLQTIEKRIQIFVRNVIALHSEATPPEQFIS